MLDLERIGGHIAELRKQQGFTQYDLADQLYVTHQAVSKWERGKSLPTIEILYDITRLFDVTLDYLLQDADIADDDYETQLRNYPRDTVITRFLQDGDTDIDRFFYLLSKPERLRVINHVIYHKDGLDVPAIWPYLNKAERAYLLGAILAGTCDFDLNRIFTQLTKSEQLAAIHQYQDGIYPYKLPYIHSID